jgi:hypothetical protein
MIRILIINLVIYFKTSTTESQLGIKKPWPCQLVKGLHGHRKITKRIGQFLFKSNAPNNMILHGSECITTCQCREQFNVLLL